MSVLELAYIAAVLSPFACFGLWLRLAPEPAAVFLALAMAFSVWFLVYAATGAGEGVAPAHLPFSIAAMLVCETAYVVLGWWLSRRTSPPRSRSRRGLVLLAVITGTGLILIAEQIASAS